MPNTDREWCEEKAADIEAQMRDMRASNVRRELLDVLRPSAARYRRLAAMAGEYENFAKIRAAIERVSERGNVVDPLDVADLAFVLLQCPIRGGA